jgi:hypothetical protein
VSELRPGTVTGPCRSGDASRPSRRDFPAEEGHRGNRGSASCTRRPPRGCCSAGIGPCRSKMGNGPSERSRRRSGSGRGAWIGPARPPGSRTCTRTGPGEPARPDRAHTPSVRAAGRPAIASGPRRARRSVSPPPRAARSCRYARNGRPASHDRNRKATRSAPVKASLDLGILAWRDGVHTLGHQDQLHDAPEPSSPVTSRCFAAERAPPDRRLRTRAVPTREPAVTASSPGTYLRWVLRATRRPTRTARRSLRWDRVPCA